MSDDRPHKPELPQDRPDRAFANALRAASSKSRAGDPDDGDPSGAGEGAETADRLAESVGEFVAEGVSGAYDVIESYIEQGREVARKLGVPTYNTVPTDALGELSSRWIKASTELTSVWFEFMSSMAENMVPVAPKAKAPANGKESRPASETTQATEAPAIQVESHIKSPLLATLRPKLNAGVTMTEFETHGLRKFGSDALPIYPSFLSDSHGQKVTVEIVVPEEQEPGLYTGALLDKSTEQIVGQLSLSLRSS